MIRHKDRLYDLPVMQPEQKLTKSGALKDYGFTTVVLQAGAEF